SARVTQYETGPDGKNLPLIATDASGREYRAANRPNLPMYAAGTSPFIGDYVFLAPSMPFVPIGLPSAPAPSFATGASTILASTQKRDGKNDDDKKKKSGPFWRWATELSDAPAPAFQAVWTDNRDVVFPLNNSAPPAPSITGNWSAYGPP